MARIRTIKPEFPQSESMGRVSRDARLLFIELWTLADDAGRLRAAPRMLASILFPYDDDAPGLIDGWLAELEGEGCLMRYAVDDRAYIQIANWASHQKIDKPSPSKIPPFENTREHSRGLDDDDSRGFANIREESATTRERSSLDQGEDQGEEGKGEEEDARAREDSFSPPPSAVASREQDPPPPRPASPPSPRNDGMTRIENHRGLWNSLHAGPPCKLLAISFTPDDQSACLRTLSAYTDEEVAKAMQNYVSIRGSPEHKVESPYRSFAGFMGRGVEKFVDDADPWNEYRTGRAGESTDMRDQVARVFAKMNQEGA